MTASVIEIDNDWVYLEIDRQIKFKARYHVRQGCRNPIPGSNVFITFLTTASQAGDFLSAGDYGHSPIVELTAT